MAKYTKEQAIKVVQRCAVQYNDNLLDRALLFMAMDKHRRIFPVEVAFTKRNYQHLTGFKTDKTAISANRFFDLCMDERLSIEDFTFADDGTTDLKLDVLPILMNKNLTANSIGDYDGSGIALYTEKIAGSVKGCMGFTVDKDTGLLMPNTVLNKDIRECTKSPQHRIVVTYRRELVDDKYLEIVYAAKKIEWDKIKFPDEYSYLPKPGK